MGVDISQPEALQPGFALLTIAPPPAGGLDGLTFSVEMPSKGFLQAYGQAPWGTTQAWLTPAAIATGEAKLDLTLGPDHTWNLKPNVTYVLRLRYAAGGDIVTLRMAWRAIRMPSQAPAALSALAPMQLQQKIVPEPEPEPTKIEPQADETLLVTPMPDPHIGKSEPDPKPVPRRKTWLWVVLALLLLAGGAAAAWYVLTHKTPAPVVAPPPQGPGPIDVPSARKFSKITPGAAENYAEAKRYLKKATPDSLQGALVLLNHAASAGNGPAATEIGKMYDPDGFDAQASAMKEANPDKALLWYQRAAQANDPEGLYHLGKLLVTGHASAPGQGPEQGAADLLRAAHLGYQPAQQELDKLHAKP